jgi:hypothetical protein
LITQDSSSRSRRRGFDRKRPGAAGSRRPHRVRASRGRRGAGGGAQGREPVLALWIDSGPGVVSRGIAIAVCAARLLALFANLLARLAASLRASFLAAAHRRGYEEHDEHDRYGDDDDDDPGAYCHGNHERFRHLAFLSRELGSHATSAVCCDDVRDRDTG